jgi:putative endonuclease
VWPFGRRGSIGQRGEKLAARTLKQSGCRILARNYRCPAGEIDLIGLTGETLVFAEVKTRSSDKYTDPQAAVDDDKRRRYRRIAQYYIQRTGSDHRPVRFDVIAIVIPPGEKPRITHIPDAFA